MLGLRSAMILIAGFGVSLNAAVAGVAESPDGVEIRYDRLGSGNWTIVFVHGWSCDRTYWANQAEAFGRGHTVLNVDLAGHGESGSGREDWTIPAFGADVASAIVNEDLFNVILVGHSMGGPVVIEAARKLDDRVKLVVAVDTLQQTGDAPLCDKASRELWAPFTEDYATSIDGFVRASFFLPDSDASIVDQVATDMAAADPAIALPAGHGLTTWDHRKAIKSIRNIPFVLINADYRPTDREALSKLHKNSRVALMSGVGHFPMLEDPDGFNELLGLIIDTSLSP